MSILTTQLRTFFANSGRNWDQLCQAAIVNACIWSGGFVKAYPSAIAAYDASKIVSHDPSKAPLGALHYWSIGSYGHVAGGLGGARVFMASKYVDEFWGVNVGVTTVQRYSVRTGAKYLGWARTNGANTLNLRNPPTVADGHLSTSDAKILAKYLNNRHLGATTTAVDDGDPGKVFWWLMQKAGQRDKRYFGLVDGIPKSLTFGLIPHYLARAKG